MIIYVCRNPLYMIRIFHIFLIVPRCCMAYCLKRWDVSNNGWFDEMNRAYLEYTLTDMADDIGCSRHKIINCVSELEGIGLIVIDRSQKGRANRIYVKNFAKRQRLSVMN